MNIFVDLITKNFQNCVWLAVLLVSACPTLESKIAIPLAMNTDFWGNNAFSAVGALFLSFLGSLLPSILIILITKQLKKRATGFWTNKFMSKYIKKSTTLDNKATNFKKYLALTGFVAIPLPLTGVWAGSIIAGLSNLNIWYSLLSIVIGAFISSSIITLLCTLFTNSISYILIFSLIIIIVFLFIDLFITMFNKNSK